MTSSLPKTASQRGWRTDSHAHARLNRATNLARFVLVIERVMPALWPAIGIIMTSGRPRPGELPLSMRFHDKPYEPTAVLRQATAMTTRAA